MKTLITYSSKTGNTKKVGKAIFNSIEGAEFKDISEVTSLDYDVIVVGTWIDKGTADAKALKFIESLENKKTAFFYTLGAYPDSDHATNCTAAITELFTKNNNEVLGHYHCQGAIDPKLIEFFKSQAGSVHAPTPERVKRWEDASKHPNEEDFTAAKEAFKNILGL